MPNEREKNQLTVEFTFSFSKVFWFGLMELFCLNSIMAYDILFSTIWRVRKHLYILPRFVEVGRNLCQRDRMSFIDINPSLYVNLTNI
jgi:hypothetical protein